MTVPGNDARAEVVDLMRQWRDVMSSVRTHWDAPDLTFTQLRALSLIAREGPMRVSGLGEALGITLAAASTLADRMARTQLITRRADPADRRSVLLEVAAHGRQLMERLERGRSEHFAKLIARMSPGERAALATTLRAFVRVSRERGEGGRG